MTDYNKGDRIRVVIEGVVSISEEWTTVVELEGGEMTSFRTNLAQIEVLERADDPAKDPVGTVRQQTNPRVLFGHQQVPGVWVKLIGDNWCFVNRDPEAVGYYTSSELPSTQVIGAVPGSPAALAPKDVREAFGG